MLKVSNLTFYYPNLLLFKNLNLSLTSGQLCMIKGPNGAGKSTFLKLVASLILPVFGQITWNNKNIKLLKTEYTHQVSYSNNNWGLKNCLSAMENLLFDCSLSSQNIQTIKESLYRVGLKERVRQMVYTFSQGQRQRLLLARLLLSKATIWILDEPFNGLDGQGHALFETILLAHLQKGGLCLLSSHQDITWTDYPIQNISLTDYKTYA
ncbi:MAG: cytochrome c biosis ATP-binding export protein ccmA [Francisellaceae bacterium]|nr:cytochrome c biosis ATP-binding export protein ccmA [Francisellaceae bacterium]